MSGDINTSTKYSSEQILHLLDELPSKLERLLEKCFGKEPYYVPDYFTFDEEANELLEPFSQYSDEIFHATGDVPEIFYSSIDLFSAKKAEDMAKIQELDISGDLSKNKTAIYVYMRSYNRLKLFFHFFGYGENYPRNMLQYFDLRYQLKNEKDPQKRQELLESFAEIMKDSSTGLYFRALVTLEKGEYENALGLCNQAIEKFPGNTPVYQLKADILNAMAAKTIEEGLEREPRDQALRIARDIEKQIWQLRKQCAEGIIDSEVLITELECLVEEKISKGKIDLSKYEWKVKESLQSFADMQPKSITLLCTGEFLLENLIEPLDFAPSAIEFRKAVENELHIHLFDRFKEWYLKDFQIIDSQKEDHDYILTRFIQGKGEVTLGAIAMTFQLLSSEKKTQKSHIFQKLKAFIDALPNPKMIINDNSISIRAMLTPDAVDKFRNSSAHLDIFISERAKDARSWCYKILNTLAEAMVS